MEVDVVEYQDKGFLTVRNLISEELLLDLEATIKKLIETAVSRLDEKGREVFSQCYSDSSDILSSGLMALHKADIRQAQFVIDAACNSQSLHSIFSDKVVLDAVAKVTGVSSLHALGAVYHYLRVDYPEDDPAHNSLISLPHHQESGYYKLNVSAKTGAVLWIPLFDCGADEGSLVVRESSHKLGIVEHESYCLDPERQRFRRVRLSDDIVDRFPAVRLNVPRRSAAFQHFNLFHASGKNKSDKVRYTMLARYTDITADDYFPVSWS